MPLYEICNALPATKAPKSDGKREPTTEKFVSWNGSKVDRQLPEQVLTGSVSLTPIWSALDTYKVCPALSPRYLTVPFMITTPGGFCCAMCQILPLPWPETWPMVRSSL